MADKVQRNSTENRRLNEFIRKRINSESEANNKMADKIQRSSTENHRLIEFIRLRIHFMRIYYEK
jgi:hypothetical protein